MLVVNVVEMRYTYNADDSFNKIAKAKTIFTVEIYIPIFCYILSKGHIEEHLHVEFFCIDYIGIKDVRMSFAGDHTCEATLLLFLLIQWIVGKFILLAIVFPFK